MPVKKILIVDDSPTELTHLRTLISDAGHLVLTATNGQEAFAKAKTDKPDLIFLDIIMPGQDGFSTCRELTADADTQHIPVVIVTNKKKKNQSHLGSHAGRKGVHYQTLHVRRHHRADRVAPVADWTRIAAHTAKQTLRMAVIHWET